MKRAKRILSSIAQALVQHRLQRSGVNALLHYARQGPAEDRIPTHWATAPFSAGETDESLDVSCGAAEGIVICNGMARSASTWSFNMAMERGQRTTLS